MTELNWEKIEKKFREKFVENTVNDGLVLAPYGEDGIEELENFIKQTISYVLDEAVGKPAKSIYDETLYGRNWITEAYNQKRQEILDLKNKFK